MLNWYSSILKVKYKILIKIYKSKGKVLIQMQNILTVYENL